MSKESNAFSAESWEYARGYAGVFGVTPSSFTSVIRSLMNEHSAGLANTAGSSKYFVLRLLRSPSLIAPFYFLCSLARKEKIAPNAHTPLEEIVKAFTPFELAYVLGLVYLTRRAQALCDSGSWSQLTDPLAKNVNTAVIVGQAIPSIGIANALMEGSAAMLGACAFLKHDPNGFKEYHRTAKREQRWDINEELRRWGCNHLQVCSVLMQTLGFGIPRANALVAAFSSNCEIGSAEENEITRDLRMAHLWREALLTTGTAPAIPLPPKYYPTKAAQHEAIEAMKIVSQSTPENCWLFKNKEDLPPHQVVSLPRDDRAAEPSTGESGTSDTSNNPPPSELSAELPD